MDRLKQLLCISLFTRLSSLALAVDTDEDGYSDVDEINYGSDPLDPLSHPYYLTSNWRSIFYADNSVSDMFWYRPDNGASQIWLMDNFDQDSVYYNQYNGNLDFEPIAIGDFDGDWDADVFFRNSSTGQNYIWEMNGGHRQSVQYPKSSPTSFNLVRN